MLSTSAILLSAFGMAGLAALASPQPSFRSSPRPVTSSMSPDCDLLTPRVLQVGRSRCIAKAFGGRPEAIETGEQGLVGRLVGRFVGELIAECAADSVARLSVLLLNSGLISGLHGLAGLQDLLAVLASGLLG